MAKLGLALTTPIHNTNLDDYRNITPTQEPHWSDNILYKKIDIDYDKLSKDHFDDLQEIHKKKYAKAKITDLDPAV